MSRMKKISGGKLKLYSHWISSCAWRVRIALNFKGLDYEYKSINLMKGDQFSPEFQNLNPMGKVPVLVDEDIVVADSFAIVMYLEDKYSQRPLLPQTLQKRAINYQVSSIVASGIQPLHNLKYIEEKFGSQEMLLCGQHHIRKGLSAVEKILELHSGRYATGDEIALADVFLAPQLGSCKRFNVDLAEFPLLWRLNGAYSELPPFQNAVPEKQPGAPNHAKS